MDSSPQGVNIFYPPAFSRADNRKLLYVLSVVNQKYKLHRVMHSNSLPHVKNHIYRVLC
jgi:hypothetical protein